MGRVTAYIVALIVVLALVGLAADVSTRSATCMVCHQQQAEFAHWMQGKLKAEDKGFSHELIACAQCHMEGAAAGTIGSRFRGLLHAVTYAVPQIDPREPLTPRLFKKARIPSENCQYCHSGAVNRKAVLVKDLPKVLQPIGLQMDHRKHLLTGEDACGRCHERYKDKQVTTADKTVNYSEVNHLSCDSCHTAASHAYLGDRMLGWTEKEFHQAREEAWNQMAKNPRWMVKIPTEKTCGRCHNGKIHFKTKIFQANCRTGTSYDNCVKCHPLMTREYFDNYRQQQSKVTSASHKEKPEG